MTIKPTSRNSGERLTSVYQEQFCGEADRLYRLAFAASLDTAVAHKVVESVFKRLADDLAGLVAGSDAEILVLNRGWVKIKELKTTQRVTLGNTVIEALAAMPFESRIAVTAIDVLGLTREDMAEVFGWDEPTWRAHLALGRKVLVTGPFGKIQLPVDGPEGETSFEE